ncbi:hypothetical protein GCM10011494_02890 [Novosphingobium endophyticum]|uniref:Uncharacterized protein n=1 Tax=Novosphingobium endophyticum TaxID=1955250 RepID=A0A916TPL8_9SPHN|nr:hypothetical protein [Novosphingobium endophyticum]GGB87970.1 hypothetical protein GCM10011494_02890 [Novosphingobium endophyticum]
MTAGVAKLILDKRQEIERIFAEHDELVGAAQDGDNVERLHVA